MPTKMPRFSFGTEPLKESALYNYRQQFFTVPFTEVCWLGGVGLGVTYFLSKPPVKSDGDRHVVPEP